MIHINLENIKNGITSGIITVVNWTMASDGVRYLYFYCDNWQIVTDKMMPFDGFRSSEHWQLTAVNKQGDILAMFPGRQIKAWVFCTVRPPRIEIDNFYLK